jgi:hypothetical protein
MGYGLLNKTQGLMKVEDSQQFPGRGAPAASNDTQKKRITRNGMGEGNVLSEKVEGGYTSPS